MEVKIQAIPIDKVEEKKYGKFDEWAIDSAVRTLLEAEEIKQDKEKMKYVHPLLQEKMDKTKKAIDSLEKLRSVAKEKRDGTGE